MGKFTPPHGLPIIIRHDNEAMPYELSAPVVYRNDITEVTVPTGFELDFASVPRPLWWLFPRVGRYARAALIHDALYRESNIDRVQADAAFLAIMRSDGVVWWQRWPMYAAVRAFGGAPWAKCRQAASKQPNTLPLHRNAPKPTHAEHDDAIRSATPILAGLAALGFALSFLIL